MYISSTKFTEPMKKFCHFFLFYTICISLSAQEFLPTKELLESDQVTVDEYFTKVLDSAKIYHSQGDYKKSLEYNIDFLVKAFASEDPLYIHQGYRMLGHNYFALNDTILARESYEKSEKFALNSNNDNAMAHAFMDLGSVFSENNHLEKAFLYHNKAISLFEKIGDEAGLAQAYYNMILSSIKEEDYRKAYIHILKTRKLNKIEENIELSIGLDYYSGLYYFHKEKYEMADKYFLKAIKGAEKADLPLELERIYDDYTQSLVRQNNDVDASNAQTVYEMYKKINEQNVALQETEEISAQFQVDEYRKDVKQAELQNQLQAVQVASQSRLNNVLIIVSSCFLFMFIALFFAYRKRKQLVRKLKVKNKEYLEAKEQSEKLSKAKSKFFSTVSHELRTPLYGVIGLSTILLEDESLKKHESDLKSLKFSADYLLALINDVLQINKIDSNNLEDEQTNFSLRELAKKITSSFEYMRIQNNNNIHIHISETIPQTIRGNSVRLSQILMNLIGNACKFTENGDIYLIAETTKVTESVAAIKFYIKDTGIGIPIDKQESIFDEFSQADSLDYKYQGTGLGLPIVKKLLTLSNSNITVESELGKGSMFTFTLLFEVSQQQLEKKKEASVIDTSALNELRILIVEDNRINQTVTKKILEKNDIHCTIAENGQEAIDTARKESFDLILMDINMPIKNGMQATREIRTFNTSVPIVALTAVEVEEMRYKIFQSGMNDIIVKPYDVSKFIQTICKNINEKESYREPKKPNLRAV